MASRIPAIRPKLPPQKKDRCFRITVFYPRRIPIKNFFRLIVHPFTSTTVLLISHYRRKKII